MNELGLGIAFVGHDQFSTVMNASAMSFNRLDTAVGRSQGRVGAHADAMVVAAKTWQASTAVLRGAFDLAGASAEFSQAVASVGAVSNASAQQLQQLEDAAIGAGIATQFSPTEAVVGLQDLAQAGFDANESIALLRPTLDLAAGSLGKLSPSGAAGLAAQTMKAFSLDIDQADVAVDQLLKTVNQFAISADQLPLALGTAARGAQAMSQGLSETLIALGLVKNVIPGVERASTAVAVAMERMVKPDTQRALKGLGVAVADAEGNFRPFLDVLLDLQPQLAKMSQQERGAFLTKTFGTESLAGIQAILGQIQNGIKGASGEIVKGAAAIEFLRSGMENAAGTAKKFADRLLDTFAGQKQLVQGSLDTLAIVVGKPFETALRPLVEGFLAVVNQVLAVVRSIPAPVQAFIAKAVVAAGAIMAIVGGIIAAKVLIAGIGGVLAAAGVSVAGLVTTLLPVVAVLGVAAAAVFGFRQAIEQNMGGLADRIAGAVASVKLAFAGLSQLFSEGGFSGQVREDLNKAENMGLKNFVVRVFGFVERLRELFSGISTGFSKAIEAARPSFVAFAKAIDGVAGPLASLFETNDAADAAASFEAFGSAGQKLGRVLGSVVETLVQVATGIAEFSKGFGSTWDKISAAMGPVIDSLRQIAVEVFGVKDGFAAGQGGLEEFGVVVGTVLAAAIRQFGRALGAVASFYGAVSGYFRSLFTIVSGVVDLIGGVMSGNWSQVWTGFKKVALGAVSAIANTLLGLVETFSSLGDQFAKLLGIDANSAEKFRALRRSITESLAESAGTAPIATAETGIAGQAPIVANVSLPEPTASVVTAGQAQLGGASAAQAAQAMIAASAEIARNAGRQPPPPNVTVRLDSAQIAAQIELSSRSEADNNFTPGLPVASGA